VGRNRTASTPHASETLFAAAASLVLVLVGVKAFYLWTRGEMGEGIDDAVGSLAAISYRDVGYAVAAWIVARGALVFAGRRRRAERMVVALFLLFGTLSALYAIASVIAFGILGGFLTYALLQLVGSVRMLSSSVGAYLSRRVELGLITVPLMYLLLVWSTSRIAALLGYRRVVRGAAAALVIAWIIVGQRAFVGEFARHYDWRIAENAPTVLAGSWWQAMRGARTVQLTETFTAEDLADFAPVGQRLQPSNALLPRRGRPASRTPRPTRPVNVILLVLESVAERWTSFGGLYETTPTLAAEAAHGMIFDNIYAHVGRSSNSLAAILLSAYPRLDFRDFTEAYPRIQRTSLASVFRDRGYRTAFMTPSDLSWAGWSAFLHTRGFDEIRDYRGLPCSELISSWGVEDRCLIDAMVDLVRGGGRPFFAMAWTQQTHHPYEPSPGVPMLDLIRDRETSPDAYDLDRYLNVLHETDRQVARLFEAVRAAGIADDTLIVAVGDHGQAFGYPHDSYLQGRTAYEEDLHVPMLVWSPRRYRLGAHAPVVGGLVDLAPTIAELTGVAAAPDWQGRSLFDPQHPPRAYFYVAQDEFKLGIRDGEWKYILDLRAGADELYDLVDDPNEQHPLHEPPRSARLRQRLAAWADANRRTYEAPVMK
jgi:phosphoglycerol transferase MdoB-like AlkP superfamily enzyme